MARKDDLAKAALDYANGIAQDDTKKLYCIEDFIAGANWSDNHPGITPEIVKQIISIYNDVMRHEEEADLEWGCDENQIGISRYDKLDFSGVCSTVAYYYNRNRKD